MNYETYALVGVILFAGGLVQGLSGFGSALVTMPLLMPLIGIRLAPPVMMLAGTALQVVILIRYRHMLSIKDVWRLSVASLLMIPFGVLLVRFVDERWGYGLLGLVLVGYSAYALAGRRLPSMHKPAWAFACGGAAGLLGGAYNTDGPPIIIYGHCRRWEPQTFKANLQVFFAADSAVILLSHYAAGNINAVVLRYAAVALPCLVAGAWIGVSLDRFVNAKSFQRICFLLLMVLGLRLGKLALGL